MMGPLGLGISAGHGLLEIQVVTIRNVTVEVLKQLDPLALIRNPNLNGMHRCNGILLSISWYS